MRIPLTYHSDYNTYGFRLDAILPILEKHGIALDIGGSGLAFELSPTAAPYPEWKQALARRRRLSVFEAVCAMGGVDPFTEAETVENYGVNGAVYDMNKALLDEAIDDDLITSIEKREGNHTQYFIEAEGFSAWCDKRNIPRPLPWVFETATPSTDPELRKALVDAQHEIAVLQSQVQTLKSQLAETGLGKDYSAVLDENSGYSPIEMRAALAAWLAVVSDGNPQLRGAAIKPALKQWLNEHRLDYKLGTEAIERCATVANWNKKGGAPKTPSRTVPPV